MATVAQLEKKLKEQNEKLAKEWSNIVYDSGTDFAGRFENKITRRVLVKWWKNENLKCFMTLRERTELWNQLVDSKDLMSVPKKKVSDFIKKVEKTQSKKEKAKGILAKVNNMIKKVKDPKVKTFLTKCAVAVSALIVLWAKFKDSLKIIYQKLSKLIAAGFVALDIFFLGFSYQIARTKGLDKFDSIVYSFIDNLDSILIGLGAVGGGAVTAGASPVVGTLAGVAATAGIITAAVKIVLALTSSNRTDRIENLIRNTNATLTRIFGASFLKKQNFELTCRTTVSWEIAGGDSKKNEIADKIYRSKMALKRLEFVQSEVKKAKRKELKPDLDEFL